MKFISTLVLSMAMFVNINGKVHSVEVQGHRGCRGTLPENTLPAFASAIESGVDTLELDLHVTQDGKVVIHHDYSIHQEMDDGSDKDSFPAKYLICNMTLSQLKKIDCGSKTNPNFPRQKRIPGIQIPTLEELLIFIHSSNHPNAKNVWLNLEIKREPRHPELSVPLEVLVTTIVSTVEKNNFSEKVYYSSFDPEVLTKIHQLYPQAKLGLIFGTETLDYMKSLGHENPLSSVLKMAQSFKAQILSPEYILLSDEKMVSSIHQLGFRVIPWTVNSSESWMHLIEMGVDGLITDYPQDLIQFLSKKN